MLGAMVLLPLLEAVLASFQDRHLSLSVGEAIRSERFGRRLDILSKAGAIGVLTCLCWASFVLVRSQTYSPETLAGWLPVWVAQLTMPVGFALMAVGTFRRSPGGWRNRSALLFIAVLMGPILAFLPLAGGTSLAVVGILATIGLAAAGLPLYAVLGGAAMLLFFASDIPIAAVPAETYRIVTQPMLPSIPLFALAGVVLARGGAPTRLVRLVSAWSGWMPGGASIAAILGCAFFTAITGASGVTILALGGLFLPILLAARHNERFSLGLLTASGSVGLLFPPSLPVILYGVYGRVAIDRLFLSGLVPGLLLLAILGIYGVVNSRGKRATRPMFDIREAGAATWAARGDLVLPVVVVVALFGGYMTVVEIAAFSALWAILLETLIFRSLDFRRGLIEAMVETSVLIGALLAILGLALGLVSFLVDAQVPLNVADWITSAIKSKWIFLLILNVMLLGVGALMDIYAAIVVVVPLIVPTATAYGIDPAHLCVIFLTNLQLGYLTPPVGMNLFLSSLRFDRPILEIWRSTMPFLLIFAVWVLLVTYLPVLSVGVADLLGR
jgi:tripartite ATP-independent transporter DctM subunit